MSATWVLDIETAIFATVKTRALPLLKERYENILATNFTMDNVVSSDAEFPNIYIHFLPSIEVGGDLDGTTINGIRTTVQCEITTTAEDGLNGARYIASVMLEQFKKLKFSCNSLPEFNGNTADTKRMVFRATRIIGANDTI